MSVKQSFRSNFETDERLSNQLNAIRRKHPKIWPGRKLPKEVLISAILRVYARQDPQEWEGSLIPEIEAMSLELQEEEAEVKPSIISLAASS